MRLANLTAWNRSDRITLFDIIMKQPSFPSIVQEYRHFGGPSARDDRARYISERYRGFISGRTLDVGCDTRRIERLNPGLDYVGIDVGGDPTIKINLEEVPRLPFEDGSFDTVICTDVLEHLEHLHRVFDELVRVCRGHMIISLPNCWGSILPYLLKGEGNPKFYGLPSTPPADRHRWMMNVGDVMGFMVSQQERLPIEVVEFTVHLRPASAMGRLSRRIRYRRTHRIFNAYAQTCWSVLRKCKP